MLDEDGIAQAALMRGWQAVFGLLTALIAKPNEFAHDVGAGASVPFSPAPIGTSRDRGSYRTN